MRTIGKFLMENSVFAVAPLAILLAANLKYIRPTFERVNPWAAPAPSPGEQLAATVDGLGERIGIGEAHAAGNGEATIAFRKAQISAVYKRNDYSQTASAHELGMSVKNFQSTLRRYGIIEWPEGHKGL